MSWQFDQGSGLPVSGWNRQGFPLATRPPSRLMRIIAPSRRENSILVSNVEKIVCGLAVALVAVGAASGSVPAGSVADIEERTRPFGELCLEGDDCGGVAAPAPVVVRAAGRSGAEVYALHCQVCHEGGLNNAPRTGDAEAWEPRLD